LADHEAVTEAVTPDKWITDPSTRRYLYQVLAAFGPIAVISGWLTQEQFILWLGFAGTVLATPIGALAAANTPNK
jgi:hypothetical protein